MERKKVSELTVVTMSLSHGGDHLLFHFVACEYFNRCPDSSDIDSVTSLLSTQRQDLYLRVKAS